MQYCSNLMLGLYNNLVTKCPSWIDVYIDIDGSNMRYADEDSEAVSKSLREGHPCVIVRTRSAARKCVSNGGKCSSRVLNVPIEVRTQKIRGAAVDYSVQDVFDVLEEAIVKIGNDAMGHRWMLQEAAGLTENPTTGYVIVERFYSVE